MGSGERVTGEFKMIELCIEPGVHGVAAFAGGRKARRGMIQNGSLKILLVARVARS